MEKTTFSFVSGYQKGDCFQTGDSKHMSKSPFSSKTLSGIDPWIPFVLLPQSLWVHMSSILLTWREFSFLLALTFFLPPLSQGSLSPKGRDLMRTSWGLSISSSLILCIMSGCWILNLFPSTTGWSWTRDWSTSIVECYYESLYC